MFRLLNSILNVQTDSDKNQIDDSVKITDSDMDLDSLISQLISQEDGKYPIIYCDPPWQYDAQENIAKESAAHCVYKTMTVEEIAKLPVAEISAPDSLIFMWVASTHMTEALWLMSEWGFRFRTIAFVWEKQSTNPGYYTQTSVEIVLVGKRGCIPTPRGSRKERQFLSERRTVHSRKPAEIRKRIERMFPDQKKIELFSREQIEGWTVWGNQSNCEDLEVKELFAKHGFPT